LSLLTDCKHGFDAGPHHLRLTLLKSPLWPDPNADRGMHHFYLCPLSPQRSWQQAKTIHQAHALNIPLSAITTSPTITDHPSKTPVSARSFLTLSPNHLILSAFKPAEDSPHQFILRCYEAYGARASLHLSNSLNLHTTATTDLLEQHASVPVDLITPHQVITYRLQT
jgi:alpha-mannosidase